MWRAACLATGFCGCCIVAAAADPVAAAQGEAVLPDPVGAAVAAAAAAAGGEAPPNLLLIFPDEWRWDYAGFDADLADLRMPNLKSLADRGTRFTSAYTPSPWCAPARACLASMREFDESPKLLNGRDFPLNVPTWYQALQKAGYHVMAAGKDDLTQSFVGTGPDGSRHAAELGFDDYFRMEDKFVTYRRRPWDQFGMSMMSRPCGLFDSGKTNLYECNDWCYGMFGRGHCCDKVAHEGYDCTGFDQVGLMQDAYVDNFIGLQSEMLLDRAPPGKPWVLHVSLPGPHPPFVITQGMNESIAGRHFAPSHDNQQQPPDQQTRIRQQYAAEIENIDAIIGTLLAKVEQRGETSNTLVVVTSDHGEQLGDHNAWGKKMPWEPSIRVPLVVSGPDVASKRTVPLPVSTLDVVGTFLQRAGVNLSGQQAFSLDPLLKEGLGADFEAYLKDRPFVPSGLTYGGFLNDPPVDFRAVVRRLNDTHTLKVICCPFGCPGGNSAVPSTAPQPQLLAFNVAAQPPLDVVNLGATEEALELAAALPGRYAKVCLPLSYKRRWPRRRTPSWLRRSMKSRTRPLRKTLAATAAKAAAASGPADARVSPVAGGLLSVAEQLPPGPARGAAVEAGWQTAAGRAGGWVAAMLTVVLSIALFGLHLRRRRRDAEARLLAADEETSDGMAVE